MKISKKNFIKEYLKGEDELDELYEPNGDFGGDKPELEVNSQIYTDTPKTFSDKSDYEEDQPIDTDKFKSNTKNTFKKLNGPYGTNMGTYRGSQISEDSEEKMSSMIKELLNKRNNDRGIFNANDLNGNNILDIDEINKGEVVSSVNTFIDSIVGNDLDSDTLGAVINYLFTTLNTKGVDLKSMPLAVKGKIKNSL